MMLMFGSTGEREASQPRFLALNDAGCSPRRTIARVAEMEVFADQVVIRQLMGDGVSWLPPPALPPTPCLPEALHFGAHVPMSDRHARVRPWRCGPWCWERKAHRHSAAAQGEPGRASICR